jgi:hypothetical protein
VYVLPDLDEEEEEMRSSELLESSMSSARGRLVCRSIVIWLEVELSRTAAVDVFFFAAAAAAAVVVALDVLIVGVVLLRTHNKHNNC